MGKRKSEKLNGIFVDKRAVVSDTAEIGDGTKIWAFAQIGDNAKIGRNCVIGNGVYVDRNVIVGNNVKIHNKALLYDGLIVEDNCYIGPGVCFTNDKHPTYNNTRDLRGISWRIRKGASVGANSTILPDINIGSNAFVGAGSVVTRSVPDGVIVCGNPARIQRKTERSQSNMSDISVEKSPVDLAAKWIVSSGIQSGKGGFFAWFNLLDGNYSYLYSEITGYGITSLLFLYKMFGEKAYIDKAELAADWITSTSMHPCGGVRSRLFDDDEREDKSYSFTGERIFSFDTGMALYGMFNLYKITGKAKYLEVSETMADFLIDKMQNQDGSLSPVYDAKKGVVIESDDKWSNQKGGFHAKVSMGMTELYRIKRNNKYRDAAVRLCEYAVTTQKESGRFVTNKTDKTTHLHPHCYAAEGLWYTGTLFKISSFVESAKKATEWAFENTSTNGINELYNPLTKTFSSSQRSDIIAQVLRLGIIFSIGRKTEELKSVLSGYQYSGEDTGQKGGFLYDKESQCVNSWCTMFAMQALTSYQHKDLIFEKEQLTYLLI